MRPALLLLLALAAPARTATLAELAEAAAARGGAREAQRAAARAAEAGAAEARRSRLPALGARVVATRGDDPVYAFGSLLQQRAFTPDDFAVGRLNKPGYRTNVKSALELGAPIFSAFELETRARLGRLAAEQARRAETGEEQRARFRAAAAYLAVAAKAGAVAAARERIAQAAEDVAAARRLKERGLALGADHLAAEAALEGLRAWQARLEGELAAERALLAGLAGRPEAELEVPARLPEPANEAGDAAAWAGEAGGRADVSAARLASEAAAASERQARWSWLPRVEAFASLETNTADFGASPSSRLLGARAWVPFGDPGLPARRRRLRESAAAQRALERRSAEEAAIEAAQAHAAYVSAVASLTPLRAMRESAARAAAAFRPLYREGRQSVLEALRAHEAAAKAEAAYLDAAAAAHAGWARLQLSVGAFDAAAAAAVSARLEELR